MIFFFFFNSTTEVLVEPNTNFTTINLRNHNFDIKKKVLTFINNVIIVTYIALSIMAERSLRRKYTTTKP